MNATALVKFDSAYYEANYDEWLKHRAKLRPYAIYLSLCLLSWGSLLALLFPRTWFIGAILACCGIYELIEAVTHRSRWINARLKATRDDKIVEFQLSEFEISTLSSVATGTIQVSAFNDVIPTKNGVYLVLDSASMYIPEATVEPRDAFRPLVDAWVASRSKLENQDRATRPQAS